MRERVPHLLAYISGHGYGHIAQTAPVLDRLRESLPELRLTVCSAAPGNHLRVRIAGDFQLISEAADFGMKMASALDVRVAESLHAYREFHHDWDSRVAREAARIHELQPDFVFSNVAYMPLAAARQAGIPCAAMCSLNWADILESYCGAMPGVAGMLARMREAYAGADAFLRVTPGMPMADLPNLQPIGPIARLGVNRRPEMNRRLGLQAGDRLVLVTLGGVATRLPVESWPRIPGLRWLVQADWGVVRPDFSTLESLDMDFTDVLAGCDAMLCKPGYGSFAEAACNGIPVLYASRHDWPEEQCLTAWLSEHGRCMEVSRHRLESGKLQESLEALWQQPQRSSVSPQGIQHAADYLLAACTTDLCARSASHRHN